MNMPLYFNEVLSTCTLNPESDLFSQLRALFCPFVGNWAELGIHRPAHCRYMCVMYVLAAPFSTLLQMFSVPEALVKLWLDYSHAA